MFTNTLEPLVTRLGQHLTLQRLKRLLVLSFIALVWTLS